MSSLNAGTITIHFTGDSAFDGLNGRLDVGIKSGATGNTLIASINANGSATIEEKGNRVTVEVPIVSNPSGSYYSSLIDDETGEPAITGSLLYPHTKFFITIEEDTTWYVCKDRPITVEDFTLLNGVYQCNRYVPYALNTGLERDYPIPLSEALKRLEGIRNTGNYRVTLHFIPWYEYLEGGGDIGSAVGIVDELSRHFEWVNIWGVDNTPLVLKSDDYDPTESSNPLVTIELLDIAYGCRVGVRELGIHSITSYQSDVTLTDVMLQLSPDLIPVIADQHSILTLRGNIRLIQSGFDEEPVPETSSLLYGDNQSVINLEDLVFYLDYDITVDSSVSTVQCERGVIINLNTLPSISGVGTIHGKQFAMGEGCIFSTTGWIGDVDGEGKPDIDFSSATNLYPSLMALGDMAGEIWLAIGTGTGDGQAAADVAVDTTNLVGNLYGIAPETVQSALEALDLLDASGLSVDASGFAGNLLNAPGTVQDVLSVIDGLDIGGQNGLSAYEVAVENGFVGSEVEWLASLVGEPGLPGTDGQDGQDGSDGLSAYQVAVNNGFVGTEVEWLATFGQNGVDGQDGADGLSAYQVAVANGFVGDEVAWLATFGQNGVNGADGADGQDGLSAYEVAVGNGFVGNEAAWLLSLKGEKGDTGDTGATGLGALTATAIKTSAYTAVSGERVACDTSAGGFTVTTPASGRFGVIDVVGVSPTTGFGVVSKELTISPASGTVMGEATLVLDVGAISPEFELVGTDWRIINHG